MPVLPFGVKIVHNERWINFKETKLFSLQFIAQDFNAIFFRRIAELFYRQDVWKHSVNILDVLQIDSLQRKETSETDFSWVWSGISSQS